LRVEVAAVAIVAQLELLERQARASQNTSGRPRA
jgi:hypothetical protein